MCSVHVGVWYWTTALYLHYVCALPLSLLPSLCALLPLLPFIPTHLLLLIFFDTSSPFSSGKFIVEGQMLRAKAQLEHLQSNIASAARKTGISSATKLALLGPSREGREEDIPLVEWWDAAILPNRR